MAKDRFTVFDWVKHAMLDKKPWNSFTEDQHVLFNSYMVHKIISMHEPYIELVNLAQKIPYTDKEKTYAFYCSILPKKFIYAKYIKGSKKNVNNDLLKHLSNYFTCGFREAEDYIYILGKEGVSEILPRLGINDKEIKTLIKEIQ